MSIPDKMLKIMMMSMTIIITTIITIMMTIMIPTIITIIKVNETMSEVVESEDSIQHWERVLSLADLMLRWHYHVSRVIMLSHVIKLSHVIMLSHVKVPLSCMMIFTGW